MRNRDLRSAGMKATWRKTHELGLIVQMQTNPAHAPEFGALAAEFRDMPVLIDHLAFPAQGTAAEYEEVIKLARQPQVYMKVSTLTEDKPPDDDFTTRTAGSAGLGAAKEIHWRVFVYAHVDGRYFRLCSGSRSSEDPRVQCYEALCVSATR